MSKFPKREEWRTRPGTTDWQLEEAIRRSLVEQENSSRSNATTTTSTSTSTTTSTSTSSTLKRSNTVSFDKEFEEDFEHIIEDFKCIDINAANWYEKYSPSDLDNKLYTETREHKSKKRLKEETEEEYEYWPLNNESWHKIDWLNLSCGSLKLEEKEGLSKYKVIAEDSSKNKILKYWDFEELKAIIIEALFLDNWQVSSSLNNGVQKYDLQKCEGSNDNCTPEHSSISAFEVAILRQLHIYSIATQLVTTYKQEANLKQHSPLLQALPSEEFIDILFAIGQFSDYKVDIWDSLHLIKFNNNLKEQESFFNTINNIPAEKFFDLNNKPSKLPTSTTSLSNVHKESIFIPPVISEEKDATIEIKVTGADIIDNLTAGEEGFL